MTTDPTAFTLSLLLIYCFLARREAGLLVVTVAGAFCWPPLLYLGSLFYVFPRKRYVPLAIQPGRASWVAAAASLVYLLALAGVWWASEPAGIFGAASRVESAIVLTIGCLVAFFFLALRTLVRFSVPAVPGVLREIRWSRVLLVVFVVLAVKLIASLLAGPEDPVAATTASSFLYETARASLVRPLDFAISHVVYFGPFVFLLCFLWRPLGELLPQYGVGAVIFVAGHLLLITNPESRQLLSAVPLFFVLGLQALERYRPGDGLLVIYGVTALVVSKIWYRINPLVDGDLLEFPMQRYFMSFGPWMSNEMYVVQGLGVLLACTALYLLVVRRMRREAA